MTRILIAGVGARHTNMVQYEKDGKTVAAAVEPGARLRITLAGDLPPIAPTAKDVVSIFRLTEAEGSPGEEGVPAYFLIETNSALQGFSTGFTFDSTVLAAESIESLVRAMGDPPDFIVATCTNGSEQSPPGCGMAVVMSFQDRVMYYPAPQEPAGVVRFKILEDAPPGAETALAFAENVALVLGSPPVSNIVVVHGSSVNPGFQDGEIKVTRLLNGKVKILGEVTLFMRGDANQDLILNIADPIRILETLFAKGRPLSCPDAADANDDGAINIADPVRVLMALFSTPGLPAPYPGMGEDTTADDLGPCLR